MFIGNCMISEKYLNQIKDIIGEEKLEKGRFFIFGSSLERESFGDVDIGFWGDIKGGDLMRLKEDFEESTLPYEVDFVDFSSVNKNFRNQVLSQKILEI